MAGGFDKLMAPGRHTRRPGRAGLRRVSLAALIMLVVQYGLGIFLNLYVAVPVSDAHAGIFAEIATAPLALTVHALLGLALIGAAILLLARAVSFADRPLAGLAATGLTAIGGAFAAGEIFVKNGQATASLAMAVLTGVALLCYVGTLAMATTGQREATELSRPVRPVQPVPLQVRPPRPRNPLTPPSPWPATPERRWPDEGRWPAEEGWPGVDGWVADEGWPGVDGWAAEEDWPAEDNWPDPPARSPRSWFARD